MGPICMCHIGLQEYIFIKVTTLTVMLRHLAGATSRWFSTYAWKSNTQHVIRSLAHGDALVLGSIYIWSLRLYQNSSVKPGNLIRGIHVIPRNLDVCKRVLLLCGASSYWTQPWVPNAPASFILGCPFGQLFFNIYKKTSTKIIKKTITGKQKLCQKASKMEPKSMPKLIKNQCQNWHRTKS